jgi:hypothetical protein
MRILKRYKILIFKIILKILEKNLFITNFFVVIGSCLAGFFGRYLGHGA